MSTAIRHIVDFVPSGRGKAQCAPNPDFPEGVALDMSEGSERTCEVQLPYPAPECGFWHIWHIQCPVCRLSIAVTAAGRPDDPVTVKLACGSFS